MQSLVQDPDLVRCCPSLSPQHPRVHCHSADGTATRQSPSPSSFLRRLPWADGGSGHVTKPEA